MKDTDWAWLAGFIDGDGCLTCSVQTRQTKTHPYIGMFPRIIIAQCKKEVQILDYIVDLTGIGKVYMKKEKSNKFNSQDQGMYTVSKLKDVKYMCENILPYVIHKKRQCINMLKIVTIKLKAGRGPKRNPIEDTLECAKLAINLNPNVTTSNLKYDWTYWEKEIPRVYSLY